MRFLFLGRTIGVAILFGLAGIGVGFAEPGSETLKRDIWEDHLIHPFDSIVLSESQIDRFLERLSQSKSKRADELQKMRIHQPDRFRWEIREEMANRFYQRVIPSAKPVTEPEVLSPLPPSEAAQKRYVALIDWLEKAFPHQAEALKAYPSLSPDYLEEVFNRYEPVMRAERYHPDLAEAMKEDIATQMQCDELLMGLPYADLSERETIIEKLNDLTARRFDLIVLKHQLQQDHLRRRLERLTQELDRQKQELETLKGTKAQAVKERVKELVERSDKASWD